MTSPWTVPPLSAGVHALVNIPGSKSLSNRALLIAALASEETVLHGVLEADDTRAMRIALQNLGARFESLRENSWRVSPISAPGRAEAEINCRQAGTVMRFVPLAGAALGIAARYDCADNARHRPQQTTVDILTQLGHHVEFLGARATMPYRVIPASKGAGPARVRLENAASSQFISALLLIGARLQGGLQLQVAGAVPSLPHIQMTVECLRERGVQITHESAQGLSTWQVSEGDIRGGEVVIEPDLTNAGPFLALNAIAPDGYRPEIEIAHWPQQTTQAGAQFLTLFADLGAERVIDMSNIGELAPTMAAVAPFLPRGLRLEGIGHLRGHETDRLAALASELGKIGVAAIAEAEALDIGPYQPTKGPDWVEFDSYDDHRMVMFAAIIGAVLPLVGGPQIRVNGSGAVAKTYPEFCQVWERLLAAKEECIG